MKPKFVTAVLLFISSFSPLFVIFAVKDFDFAAYKFSHPVFTIIMLGSVLLSVIILFLIFSKIDKGNVIIKITSVGNRSTDLINYTIPYMLSFIGINLGSPADLISVSIFLFILMMLTITSKSVFVNPILAMAGYGLYDIVYEYNNKTYSTIVISKYSLHQNEKYYIRNLTQFMSMITGVDE